MLVLSRSTNDSIIIADNIEVVVLGIEGDKVKLGVKAPRHIAVLRHELWQAIREQESIAESLAANPKPDSFEELRQLLVAEVGGPGDPQETPKN